MFPVTGTTIMLSIVTIFWSLRSEYLSNPIWILELLPGVCIAHCVSFNLAEESVKDEITVRIVYEGRAAKIALNNSELENIEKYYEEAADAGANEYQIEQSKEETTKMNSILGDPKRLKDLALDFVTHYENRISEGATIKGKSMFVCSSREIAYELFYLLRVAQEKNIFYFRCFQSLLQILNFS